MIVVYHDDNKVLSIEGTDDFLDYKQGKIISILFQLASKYPQTILVWCHQSQKQNFNQDVIKDIFHHKNMMISYCASQSLPEQIGYVEFSPFININKKVTYPTWLMSSEVGAIYGPQLSKFEPLVSKANTFEYTLNSIAKLGMPNGLFCYSEPCLLKDVVIAEDKVKMSISTLYKFVKQHYKAQWVFVLFFCYLIYEKKLTFLTLIKTLFYKRLKNDLDFEMGLTNPLKQKQIKRDVDVIIPTLGRKTYLYDVLKDLSHQTVLPKNVIIVEQNPLEGSVSELDYLVDKTWPFNIKHTFTHQLGVCNARNMALSQVESTWVFLADDDIRFNEKLIEDSFNTIEDKGIDVLSYLCLLENQEQTYFKLSQTTIFASGSSFVKSSIIEGLKFNKSFEFGFGEDTDFGMQIRNAGHDVFFVPNIKTTHIKAPIGGFRKEMKKLWSDEKIQPKPMPTIQLLNQTYFTSKQLLGYKFMLAIKFYKSSPIKNPVSYIKDYRQRWKESERWANVLKQKFNG